jgi:branched-chain amino acid transport system ATP-binding protein
MSAVPSGTSVRTAANSAVLTGSGLVQTYGALQVLSGVDFTVADGEAVGIVGPNGAGKTTLLNVLAGSVRPSAGTVTFDGHDVTRLRPELRCRRGIGRAFQIPKPFLGMTTLENVLVGASYGAGLTGQAAYDRGIEVLDLCGLTDLANRRADNLGLLHRKRLELARGLATDPKVLLLDEIGGGLTDAEAAELVTTINLIRERGIAIVWIEHIVHILVQVVKRLVCMDGGRIIADGPPKTVLNDAVVMDAYLGKAGS